METTPSLAAMTSQLSRHADHPQTQITVSRPPVRYRCCAQRVKGHVSEMVKVDQEKAISIILRPSRITCGPRRSRAISGRMFIEVRRNLLKDIDALSDEVLN
jgi:hypothetical protein